MSKKQTNLGNTKLIKVLSNFVPTEWQQFEVFLNSAFFNKNSKVIQLFEFIQKQVPNFDRVDFTLEVAFHYIYPTEIYKKDRIIKLCSQLFKLVEQYIIHQSIMDDEGASGKILLKYYNERHLTYLFQNTYKQNQKKLAKSSYRNSEYYQKSYSMDAQYASFLSLNEDDGTGDVYFQQTTNSLDVYYLCQKLEQLCQMKNRQRAIAFDYRFDLMEEIIQFLPNSTYFDLPVIQIWYYALQLLVHPQEDIYNRLKTLIQQNEELLDTNENRMIYTYLENSCRQVIKNDKIYYEELFDLYRLQLKNNSLYVNGYLDPMTFRNIVTVGLKLKALDWTAQFIKENEDKIVPDYVEKEDMVSLCKALLLFEQGAFESCLDYLNVLKYNNIYTKLDERRIRLKVYYELDLQDLLEGLINSFRKFISKNKKHISERYITLNRNFINMVNTINRFHHKDKKEIEALKIEIQEMNLLAEKAWLLQKLTERTT